MIDGHRFVDAYFTDIDRINLETLWYCEADGKLRVHNIVAEEGDREWEKFLKTPIDETGRCATLEDLYERTYIKRDEDAAAKKEIAKKVIDEEGFVQARDELAQELADLKVEHEKTTQELWEKERKVNEDIEARTRKKLDEHEAIQKATIMKILDLVVDMDNAGNEEQDKEQLFLFKLALFEWERLSHIKDKEVKKSIRKAKNVLEALKIVVPLLEHRT
tara:strand:- start:5462 stop:6118 length:657 start_codon:yes stop_codon:yes gene_type:complete